MEVIILGAARFSSGPENLHTMRQTDFLKKTHLHLLSCMSAAYNTNNLYVDYCFLHMVLSSLNDFRVSSGHRVH